MGLFKKIFDHEYKELDKFEKIADAIEELDESMQALTDDELKAKTIEFKQRLADGETLEDILVEAFAVAREASWRSFGQKHYYVQLVGGIAIHYGNIAEMKTGEGKTLTEVLPAYLNALNGEGVHIITVNEYLSSRDAEWMGQIFNFLGLTVGINGRDLSPEEKRQAYEADITYTTNNEVGFDYLRDNMVVQEEDRVLRGLNFAIIDEVDSVLIDEARTPLIISGGVMKSRNLYLDTDRFVKTLKNDVDYNLDEKTNRVSLTDEGSLKAEKAFNLTNLYDVANSGLVHHITQALRANYTMHNDIDYVVQDGQVVIVDQFTGRLMKGRAFSEGLHQAIEAKEGVTIQQETMTLATITFQNLFRMYKKLSGMTGTAKTEEEEFRNIYNMYVIQIPTNKPMVREDMADLVYGNKEGKYAAIVRTIEEFQNKGQPVLVGTIAIETSELISNMLTKKKIKHEVLNAKNHGREAEIIANAGVKGSVTIATNMAGRGTDIKLGEGVKELGGLAIIGTERHESRRIDNQLRGRAGRQGDPGFSQFYVSLEDELMIRFGSDRVKGMLANLGFTGEQAIRSSVFSKSIEQAQKRVEGNNFDARKSLLQYDDVMNNQREIMYTRRNEVIDSKSIHDEVLNTFRRFIDTLISKRVLETVTDNDAKEIIEALNDNFLRKTKIKDSEINGKKIEDVIELLQNLLIHEYELKISALPDEIRDEFEKAISLRVIDTHWMEHINTMEHLKEGIGLRGYAQGNPLQAYTVEGFNLFDIMLDQINEDITTFLMKAEVKQNLERKEVMKGKAVDNSSEGTTKKPKRVEKTGRNEACPCGSGKKYKNCCGK